MWYNPRREAGKMKILNKPVKMLVMVEKADKRTLETEARKQKISVSALVRKFAEQLRGNSGTTAA